MEEKKKKDMTVKEMSQKGNAARKAKLTYQQRKEIAQKAAKARWDKKKGNNNETGT